MGGERTVRNLPLSRILYIYESTTPINVVGARQTREHQLSSGDTHPRTSPVSLFQPPAIIASLPPQTPPAVPLIIRPQRTIGPS